jgi:hypothetical protein
MKPKEVVSGIVLIPLGLFFASLCTYVLVRHFFLGKFPIFGDSIYSEIALALIFGFTSILGIAMIIAGMSTLGENFRKVLKH